MLTELFWPMRWTLSSAWTSTWIITNIKFVGEKTSNYVSPPDSRTARQTQQQKLLWMLVLCRPAEPVKGECCKAGDCTCPCSSDGEHSNLALVIMLEPIATPLPRLQWCPTINAHMTNFLCELIKVHMGTDWTTTFCCRKASIASMTDLWWAKTKSFRLPSSKSDI